MLNKIGHKLGIVGFAVGFLCLSGCIGITDIFSSDLIGAITGQSGVASLPGNAPAIRLNLENNTTRNARLMVTYRDGDNEVQTIHATVSPNDTTSQALACPISQITLGDITNPSEIGAYVILGAGTTADPYIAVEPFGVVLLEESSFECGDSITFSVSPSSQTASGYRIFAAVRSGS